MEKKIESIPFVKPARIGNFKLWRSNMFMGGGKGKKGIEQINVSNMDGSWLVRIPQTFEMFGMITAAYAWYQSENEEERKRGVDFLVSAFSNMFSVSCVCNGFFHSGVQMVTAAYAEPDVLRDRKRYKLFRKEAEGLVSRFLDWRSDYDKSVSEYDDDGDAVHGEMVEKAVGILAETEQESGKEASDAGGEASEDNS